MQRTTSTDKAMSMAFKRSRAPSTPLPGFTLIETMVAISLIAIALTGPFTAVQIALRDSYIARDRLVASELAQEAMEYIRSIRDNNHLSNRSFVDGLSDAPRDGCYGVSQTGYCIVDPTQGDFHTIAAAMQEVSGTSTAGVLYISNNGMYNQQVLGTPSRFKRLVRVYTISATEVMVVVHMVWTSGTQSYSSVLVGNLQDWI